MGSGKVKKAIFIFHNAQQHFQKEIQTCYLGEVNISHTCILQHLIFFSPEIVFKTRSVIGKEMDSSWIEFMSLSQFNVGSSATLSEGLQGCNEDTRKSHKCCQSPIAFISIPGHIARFSHAFQKCVLNNLDMQAHT